MSSLRDFIVSIRNGTRRHKLAVRVIIVTAIIDLIIGIVFSLITPGLPLWHGLYCSLADGVTRGGDCPLTSTRQYLLSAIEDFTVVPLFAATFSLFTSSLTEQHARLREHRMMQHVTSSEGRIKAHVEKHAVKINVLPESGISGDDTVRTDQLESHSDTTPNS